MLECLKYKYIIDFLQEGTATSIPIPVVLTSVCFSLHCVCVRFFR